MQASISLLLVKCISAALASISLSALTNINPALAVANWVITHSLMLGPHIPTRSPFLNPIARSPAARLFTYKINKVTSNE